MPRLRPIVRPVWVTAVLAASIALFAAVCREVTLHLTQTGVALAIACSVVFLLVVVPRFLAPAGDGGRLLIYLATRPEPASPPVDDRPTGRKLLYVLLAFAFGVASNAALVRYLAPAAGMPAAAFGGWWWAGMTAYCGVAAWFLVWAFPAGCRTGGWFDRLVRRAIRRAYGVAAPPMAAGRR